MADKPYHHGNLKNGLSEFGIELINEEGLNGFSLRKVAAKCGVSNAAPLALPYFFATKKSKSKIPFGMNKMLLLDLNGGEDVTRAVQFHVAFREPFCQAYFPL